MDLTDDILIPLPTKSGRDEGGGYVGKNLKKKRNWKKCAILLF